MTLTAAGGNWVEVKGATGQFTVNQFLDQFRKPLATQPTLTWSVTTIPSGALQPTLSLSGKTVTVTVSKAGCYDLTATASDGAGHFASMLATLIVDPVATSIAQFPAASVVNGASKQFTDPAVLDEFGNVMAFQPFYSWSATTFPSGAQAPTFNTSGTTTTVTFHKAGSYVLRAFDTSAPNLAFSTTVTVNQVATRLSQVPPATVAVNGSGQQFSDPVVLDEFGNALAIQPGYTWVATTVPGGATIPTFSTSGTVTTVTFSKACSYGLKAYVTSASNLAFSLTATVNQVATSFAQLPVTTVVINGTSLQFSDPAAFDEFGNAMATSPVILGWPPRCPAAPGRRPSAPAARPPRWFSARPAAMF